jgi:hypothetical protein
LPTALVQGFKGSKVQGFSRFEGSWFGIGVAARAYLQTEEAKANAKAIEHRVNQRTK